MSDDKRPDDKPNPLEDVRKGLGLLFRAAVTTVEKLPTKEFEEHVATTVKEVGRALENVGKTIEREVLGGKRAGHEDGRAEREEEEKKDEEKPE